MKFVINLIEFIDSEISLLLKFKENYIDENKKNPDYLSHLRDRMKWIELLTDYYYNHREEVKENDK